MRNPTILRALINDGRDVNSRGEEGATFLLYATAECSYECVKLLVEAGTDINASADDGATPLTQAAKWIYFRPDIVRTFLNAGANVNAEFTDNDGRRLFVLDIMFKSAD